MIKRSAGRTLLAVLLPPEKEKETMATRDEYARWVKAFLDGDLEGDDVADATVALIEDGYMLTEDGTDTDDEEDY